MCALAVQGDLACRCWPVGLTVTPADLGAQEGGEDWRHLCNRDIQAGTVLLLSSKQTAVDIPVTGAHFQCSMRLDSTGGGGDRGIKLSESG